MFNNAKRHATIADSMVNEKGSMVGVRVSDEDRAAWQAAADADGRTLSAWVKRRCNGEPTTEPVRAASSPPVTKPAANSERKSARKTTRRA
jgi:hypothetical protein